MKRYVCIHGHFYQPPRENPWLQTVEREASASPSHDWNERILHECYQPISRARIHDKEGRVTEIFNAYSRMSFNFGPTLLHWMRRQRPDILALLVEADRESQARFEGHGNAIAQAYNHLIMPLASRHDKETQVRWGIADFLATYGRLPEGMWLPETAVDLETLDVLAEQGIRFTILSPRQAKRCRPLQSEDAASLLDPRNRPPSVNLRKGPIDRTKRPSDGPSGAASSDGEAPWREVHEHSIDPRRAYLCRLKEGRSITLFFYHGGLASDVAFGGILHHPARFYDRIHQAFQGFSEDAALSHLATDGETYGHHLQKGEQTLAWVLQQIERRKEAELINYGLFLERHPPTWEAEIHDRSSWSCSHGVERWRSDCGCHSGASGWQHLWRSGLRMGLNALKGRLDALFEAKGSGIFHDPWAARNAYIELIHDRKEARIHEFFHRHLRPRAQGSLDPALPLALLEMQHNAMLMFTSCGWFFDDISGLESVTILKYALCAIQIGSAWTSDLEESLLEHLAQAPSNLPQWRDGAYIWEKVVKPSQMTHDRVLASVLSRHHLAPRTSTPALPSQAPSSVASEASQAPSPVASEASQAPSPVTSEASPSPATLGSSGPTFAAYAYQATIKETWEETKGDHRLVMGVCDTISKTTLAKAKRAYALLHLGRLDFHLWLTPLAEESDFASLRAELQRIFHAYPVGHLYEKIRKRFDRSPFGLDELVSEDVPPMIAALLGDWLPTYDQLLLQAATQDREILHHLTELSWPCPPSLRLALSLESTRRIAALIEGIDKPDAIDILPSWSPSKHLQDEHRKSLQATLQDALLRRLRPLDDPQQTFAQIRRLFALAEWLGFSLASAPLQDALLSLAASSPLWLRAHRPFCDEMALAFHLSPALLSPTP